MLKLNIVNTLVISCDGNSTPEDFERLRPPAKWSKLMEFIERISRLHDRLQCRPAIKTRTVIEDQKSMHRWNSLLAPYPISPEFRGWKYLPEAVENMTGRDITPPAGVCLYVQKRSKLFIDHNGDVVPCCAHPNAGHFGNIGQTKFSEIVEGEQRRKFEKLMSNSRHTMPVCSKCDNGSVDAPGLSAIQNLPGLQA